MKNEARRRRRRLSGKRFDDHFPERVILHCAATPDHFHNHKSFDKWGKAEIHQWHVIERGYKKVGYQYIIRRTGEIERGRDDFEQGAHTLSHNYRSIGICLMGTKIFTPEQMDSLSDLYVKFRDEYGIPANEWFGHCEYDPVDKPDCPGTNMDKLRDRFED